MRKNLLSILSTICVVALSATAANARTLDADEALARALEANDKTQSAFSAKASTDRQTYKLKHATRGYYVFDRSAGGYMIVSADDRLCATLAVVDEGSFDLDNLPPAARWLTDLYEAEIEHFLATEETRSGLSVSSSLPTLYGQWTDIAPLMTTRWGQDAPYNNLCPMESGSHCVTGCVATAMAQIVKAIGFYEGKGYKSHGYDETGRHIEFDYASATFDLPNMHDAYSTSMSAEAKDEVARLMLACGVGVNMNYTAGSSGAATKLVPNALINHFGYGDATCYMTRDQFDSSVWENTIYTELSLGRPVLYSGSGSSGAHAYVIDGYRRNGLWHVNWGWDGRSDGYFRLSVLNPTNSAGKPGEGFDRGQAMVKAVPPGANPGIVTAAETSLVGSMSVCDDEGVYHIVYESFAYNPDMTLGAVITTEAGERVAETVFWTGINFSAGMTIRDPNHRMDLSEFALKPGRYRIYPAYRTAESEEPLTITKPYSGRCHYVELAVADNGSFASSNSRFALLAVDIEAPSGLCTGYEVPIDVVAVNDMTSDYAGTVTVKLIADSNNSEPICSCDVDMKVVGSHHSTSTGSIKLTDAAGNPIATGTYAVAVTTDSGVEIAADGLSVEVTDGTPKSDWQPYDYPRANNTASMPDILASGATWPHTAYIENLDEKKNVRIGLSFYRSGSNSAVKTYQLYSGTLPMMWGYLTMAEKVAIDLPMGIYEVAYTERNSAISDRHTVKISQNVDGLNYVPAVDGEVAVAPHPEFGYEGNVVVPESVEINGTTYAVTSFEKEAFATCRGLLSVDVPASVTRLDVDALAYCASADQLLLRNDRPVFRYRNLTAPGLNPEASIYVTPASWASYDDIFGNSGRVFVMIDRIESKELEVGGNTTVTMAVEPANDAIDKRFTIAPADEEADAIADLEVKSVENGLISIDIRPMRNGTQTFAVASPQLGVEPGLLTLTVTGTSSITDIVTNGDDEPEQIFDLSGRKLRRDATGLSGFYIVVSRGKARKVFIAR